MKKPVFFLLILVYLNIHAQYRNPIVNANFGVDAELIANSCKKDSVAASDDWFSDGTNSKITGAGTNIIDTSRAASIAARYVIDPEFRKSSFYRRMKVPSYSLLTNRLIIDGVFIRDYHGIDSTTFSSGNKNGQYPADWTTPVSRSLPDRNDIEDMFLHVKRSGPTSSYDLWMFGGISIVGSAGNRFYDLELYQTDLYYDRFNRKFIGYGPDEGHTSWAFDALGNVLKPGDIIFSGEFSTAASSFMEARIWVNKNDLNITPAAFNWSKNAQGKIIYDSASVSSLYVYAAIVPKTSGSFYSGVQSTGITWAGPFKYLDVNNNVQDNYGQGEFFEYSINFTKLGIDWGSSSCDFPFKRALLKSRESKTFSSPLNDFVGPYKLFQVPKVKAQAANPILCATNGTSKINVLNAYSTSVYTWSTPDGNITDAINPTSITVNKPGMYIVTQQLKSGCDTYAKDTVIIVSDPNCMVLNSKGTHLNEQIYKNNFIATHTSLIIDRKKLPQNLKIKKSNPMLQSWQFPIG